MIRKSLILTSMILAVTLILGVTGCGDAGGEASTKAPVRLFISSLNDGDQMQISVIEAEGGYLEEEISCQLTNEPINPVLEDTSYYMDVICKGYEVSYIRKDIGSRVPETFTGSLTSIAPVGESTSVPIVICRVSQKMMPPLNDLCEFGYDQETGLAEIHMSLRVVVWGETFAGEEVVTDPAMLTANVVCTWSS